jgi:CheY-like chemotaxis protein
MVPTHQVVLADLKNWAVLVIDDEPSICRSTTEVLSRWGCRSLAAESATEAIARLAAEQFEPDAIIADYRLREGRTGAEAIDEVRRTLGRQVPALILTGDTAPERLIEARASGCLLLHKPMQPARLRAALASLREAPIACPN